MSGKSGRKFVIKKDSVAIAGARTKSAAINNEPVNISSDDDDGWRKLLEEPGEQQIDLSVSGVAKDDTLRAINFGESKMMDDIVLEFGDGAELSGSFYLASYTESGDYNEAITFEASLQSSGEITYTPASP